MLQSPFNIFLDGAGDVLTGTPRFMKFGVGGQLHLTVIAFQYPYNIVKQVIICHCHNPLVTAIFTRRFPSDHGIKSKLWFILFLLYGANQGLALRMIPFAWFGVG